MTALLRTVTLFDQGKAGQDEPVPFHALLTEWRYWMQAAGMSARTIKYRTETIDLFARRADCNPATADWRACAVFLSWPGLSRGTQVNYYATMKAWFTYLNLTDVRLDNPLIKLKRPKSPRRQPRPITVDQLAQLLSTGVYRRTRMMIILASFQGLRVSEVAQMRGEYLRGDMLRVIGKGDVDATIPAHPLVVEHAVNFPQIGLWFPSIKDPMKSMTGRSVGSTISQAMRRAGFDATAHQLRHWFGTNTLRSAEGNVRVVQELMRHASITSTMGYTLVEDRLQREAINSLPVPLHIIRSRRS